MNATSPVLLTPTEVADLLRVSPQTVRRYARRGLIERVRFNARVDRYTAASVAALIDPDHRGSAANADGRQT